MASTTGTATKSDNILRDDETIRSLKLSLYLTLKNLYEKWLSTRTYNEFKLKTCGEEFEEVKKKINNTNGNVSNISEYSNYLYVDSFYKDIGNEMMLNPLSIVDLVRDHRDAKINYSAYQAIGKVAGDNKLLFICLPVFNNYYSENTISEIFKPKPSLTMNVGRGTTYILMYTGMMSKKAGGDKDDEENSVEDDHIDIADSTGNILPETASSFLEHGGDNINIKVPAFGVTYSRQNQNYFTNISVNMDAPKLTDFSIRNQFKLAQTTVGPTNETSAEPMTIAQDAYSIFANQSFNCSVEMLGCMNIMPMMYFQLNNIPLFRGAYFITNVEHNISPGNMVTKFIGTRISKVQVPYKRQIFGLAPAMKQFIGNVDVIEQCGFSFYYGNGEVSYKNRKEFEKELEDSGFKKDSKIHFKPSNLTNKYEWRIGYNTTKEKDKSNQGLCPLKSTFSNDVYEFGKVYSLNTNTNNMIYGFAKYGILEWLSKCYVNMPIPMNYNILCDSFWEKPRDWGFELVAEYILVSKELVSNGGLPDFKFQKGDVMTAVAIHKDLGYGKIFRVYSIYNGEFWLDDFKHTKLWPFDNYILYEDETIQIWRYDETVFQTGDIYATAMRNKEDAEKALKDYNNSLKRT